MQRLSRRGNSKRMGVRRNTHGCHYPWPGSFYGEAKALASLAVIYSWLILCVTDYQHFRPFRWYFLPAATSFLRDCSLAVCAYHADSFWHTVFCRVITLEECLKFLHGKTTCRLPRLIWMIPKDWSQGRSHYWSETKCPLPSNMNYPIWIIIFISWFLMTKTTRLLRSFNIQKEYFW
jgi:hypothetical protein